MNSGSRRDERGFADRFFGVVCDFGSLLRVLLSIELLFVVLNVFAFLLSPAESAGRVVTFLTLPANAFVIVCTGGLIYVCGSRRR